MSERLAVHDALPISCGLRRLVSRRYYTFDAGRDSAIVSAAAIAIFMNGRLNGRETWMHRRWDRKRHDAACNRACGGPGSRALLHADYTVVRSGRFDFPCEQSTGRT